jgi:indole-3-glycerol phosphate synthase
VARATILEDILAHKRSEISLAKSKVSLAELESRIVGDNPARGFANAIRQRVSQRQPAVIAEIKKASPSKGLIRADFDPVAHARDYAANGATCLSILTDQKFFQGCNDYLQQARAACQLPVIRKDFMIDPYQIAESKALGADCILLIVAALEQSQLLELSAYAGELSIDVLVEVHDRQELERALELDTELLGINNRNLHTFETDLNTTLDLAQRVPAGKLIITESGIDTAEGVASMMSHGIYGFLIGESFMKADEPGAKLQQLFYSPG